MHANHSIPQARAQKPLFLKVGKIVGVAKYLSNIRISFFLDLAYGNYAYHFRFVRR